MAREFSKAFYHSKEWKTLREFCLMRDHYLCQHCGCPAEEVHHIVHITPANIGDTNVTLNPNNLISLCKACHFAEHKGEHAGGLKAKNELPNMIFDENGYLIEPPINFKIP